MGWRGSADPTRQWKRKQALSFFQGVETTYAGGNEGDACQAAGAKGRIHLQPMSRRQTYFDSDAPTRREWAAVWLMGLLWLGLGTRAVGAGSSVVLATPVTLVATATPLPAANPNTNWIFEATNRLGRWIWDTNTFDKQTSRLWKGFEIPRGAQVSSAILDITVDNSYTLFLDGREIGRGSDWRTVTEYDVTQLLGPGRHGLGVEGFNDRLAAGLILGLHLEYKDGSSTNLVSDDSWWVVVGDAKNWSSRKSARPDWHPAVVVGAIHHPPWEVWPYGLTIEPPLQPLVVHFWEEGWFQVTILVLLGMTIGACVWLQAQLAVQARSQQLLQAERVRIARDIHDDLGAQVTQLVLLGEVAQREHPETSLARTQFNEICSLARELSHGMDEVVWAVNARRDTLRDFANYVCKYAQVFLNPTEVRCRLDVEPDLPPTWFDLPLRRNLFLAVKEALNNAAKHSGATELFLRIHRANGSLVVIVEDNGRGFDPEKLSGERNGMANMTQRMAEIRGQCEMDAAPGAGCRLKFTAPISSQPHVGWLNWLRGRPRGEVRAPETR
jgi:signal transduction histidine kinase